MHWGDRPTSWQENIHCCVLRRIHTVRRLLCEEVFLSAKFCIGCHIWNYTVLFSALQMPSINGKKTSKRKMLDRQYSLKPCILTCTFSTEGSVPASAEVADPNAIIGLKNKSTKIHKDSFFLLSFFLSLSRWHHRSESDRAHDQSWGRVPPLHLLRAQTSFFLEPWEAAALFPGEPCEPRRWGLIAANQEKQPVFAHNQT